MHPPAPLRAHLDPQHLTGSWADETELKGGRERLQYYQNSQQPSFAGPVLQNPVPLLGPGPAHRRRGRTRLPPAPQKWSHLTSPADCRVGGTKELGWRCTGVHLLRLPSVRVPRRYPWSPAGSGELSDCLRPGGRRWSHRDHATVSSQSAEPDRVSPRLGMNWAKLRLRKKYDTSGQPMRARRWP